MAAQGDGQVDGSEERPGTGGPGTSDEPAGAGGAPAVALTTEEDETTEEAGTTQHDETSEDDEATDESAEVTGGRSGMTPRQARRVRAVVSGVVMVVVAVALVLRLGSAPSLLTVGGYGLALVLSGTAIVLSRRGRTRVATAVLACGFVTIILAERALAGS